jgi:TRAP-type mannitol/chloroaromatic compound transport system permease small subunit
VIDTLHDIGLWTGNIRPLGIALPLWMLAAAAVALVLVPRALDAVVGALGSLLTALMPIVVLLCFGLVAARYGFGKGSIAAQEAMLSLHALVFMLGAAFALQHNRHVRVDVLQQRLSARTQAWIEAGGMLLLLLPFALFMLWISLDYVAASWQMQESSREPGGLPGVYLLKALIPAAAWLLAVQAVALMIRAVRAAVAPAPQA